MKMRTTIALQRHRIGHIRLVHLSTLGLRFSFRCLLSLLLVLQPIAISFAWEVRKDVPHTESSRPASIAVAQSNVDLTVTDLNISGIITNSQTLAISGELGVTMKNLGTDSIDSRF